jgi:hypothetical protein
MATNPLDESPRARLNRLLVCMDDLSVLLMREHVSAEGKGSECRTYPHTQVGKLLKPVFKQVNDVADFEREVLEASLIDTCEREAYGAQVVVTHFVLDCHKYELRAFNRAEDDRTFSLTLNQGETGPLFLDLPEVLAEVRAYQESGVPFVSSAG